MCFLIPISVEGEAGLWYFYRQVVKDCSCYASRIWGFILFHEVFWFWGMFLWVVLAFYEKCLGSRHKLISPSSRSVPDELFRTLGEMRIQINNDREIIGKKFAARATRLRLWFFRENGMLQHEILSVWNASLFCEHSSWSFCVIEKQFLRQRIFICDF